MPPPRCTFSAKTLAPDARHAVWFADANRLGRLTKPFIMFQCLTRLWLRREHRERKLLLVCRGLE
jgi:hypothetical protein